jgi:murein DD-endopeptidase MepM/ murein hydrolase activator NlpD
MRYELVVGTMKLRRIINISWVGVLVAACTGIVFARNVSHVGLARPDNRVVEVTTEPTAPVLMARFSTPQTTLSTLERPAPIATSRPSLTPTTTNTLAATIQILLENNDPPSLTPSPDPLSGFQICSPLADIVIQDLPRLISEAYNPPPMGSDARHQGVDFAFYNWKGHRRIDGTVIQSVLPGQIAAALNDTFPFGNLVIIETRSNQLPEEVKQTLQIPEDRSLYLLYAHMKDESLLVQLNDTVKPCQPIGAVGNSGNTLASHLHLETRIGPPGMRFTGFSAFVESASEADKKNYRLWRISGQFLHFNPMNLLLFGFKAPPSPTPPAPEVEQE